MTHNRPRFPESVFTAYRQGYHDSVTDEVHQPGFDTAVKYAEKLNPSICNSDLNLWVQDVIREKNNAA